MEKLFNQQQNVAENLVLLKKIKGDLIGWCYLDKDEKYGKNKRVQKQSIRCRSGGNSCGAPKASGRTVVWGGGACFCTVAHHSVLGPLWLCASMLPECKALEFSDKGKLLTSENGQVYIWLRKWQCQQAVWKMERYFINGLLQIFGTSFTLVKNSLVEVKTS